MPTDKDFKRLLRGRMLKTGESYTAARAHFLKTQTRSARRPVGMAAVAEDAIVSGESRPLPKDYATLAGLSDAAVKAKTGCTWEKWVAALDYAGAHEWSHREIAAYVQEKFKTPSWWTQTVTVGYERIKGLRAIGQRRDGGYSATKSRTFPVPVSRLYRAFRDSRSRARWLPDTNLTVRSATRDKAISIIWPDGTRVVAGFISKGAGKSQVAIEHSKLVDKASSEKLKLFWSERFKALADNL
jgi:hypothetical protein